MIRRSTNSPLRARCHWRRVSTLRIEAGLIAAIVLCGFAGCGDSTPSVTSAPEPAAAESTPHPAAPTPEPAPTETAPTETAPTDATPAGDDIQWTSNTASIESDLQLPPIQEYPELVEFLREVDREIQRLGTEPVEPEQRDALTAELERIARLKQEAAERMLADPSLTDAQTTVAIRGRMQALSHRAAMGDLAAAGELETYAIELLNHPTNDIARDSRTVLVGFALERLQGGVTTAPDEVLRFTSELTSHPELLDASSIKALERAMVVLSRYGYTDAANTIRGELRAFVEQTDDAALAAFAERALQSHSGSPLPADD